MLSDQNLAQTEPELASEWSERNFPFTPEYETPDSDDRVWWKGKCGHEWFARIRNRTSVRRTGCPYCTSHVLLPGFNDLATKRPDVAAEWSEKNLPLKPSDVMPGSPRKVWWKGKCGHEWQEMINNRTGREKKGCPVCYKAPLEPGVNDLATEYPEVAALWSVRNKPLEPTMIRASYKKQLWWKCPVCGNEYKGQIRTQKFYAACPICRGVIVKRGINDLATTHPKIAAEWDPENNGNLTPAEYTAQSKKFARWICRCGCKWGSTIYARTMEGKKCPECGGKEET